MADSLPPRRGLSLEERSRLSGLSAAVAPAERGAHRRHCWVLGEQGESGPYPGLVLHWDRSAVGWRAWVVYLAGEGVDHVAVQAWVARDRLAPAD